MISYSQFIWDIIWRIFSMLVILVTTAIIDLPSREVTAIQLSLKTLIVILRPPWILWKSAIRYRNPISFAIYFCYIDHSLKHDQKLSKLNPICISLKLSSDSSYQMLIKKREKDQRRLLAVLLLLEAFLVVLLIVVLLVEARRCVFVCAMFRMKCARQYVVQVSCY